MNSNEAFEIYAEKFYKKFGYLPLGKSDPLRPNVENVLADLGATYCELLEIKEAQKKSDNNGKVEICSNNSCDYCVSKVNDMPCGPCKFVGRKLQTVS